MKPKVVMTSPTGLVVWALPGTDLEVMWAGPGSSLMMGHPRRPGGFVTPINSSLVSGQYMTRKEAEAAVAVFITAAEELTQ